MNGKSLGMYGQESDLQTQKQIMYAQGIHTSQKYMNHKHVHVLRCRPSWITTMEEEIRCTQSCANNAVHVFIVHV